MALGTQVVLSPCLRRGTLLILQPVWDARARPWCSFSAQGLGEAGQRQQRARKVTGGNSEDRHHAPAHFCPGQLWEPVGKRERAAPHLPAQTLEWSSSSEGRAVPEKCSIQGDLDFGKNTASA